MRRGLRVVHSALFAMLVPALACIPLPHGHELSSRTVTGKRDDDTLLADDGSWCRVGPAVFERAKVGEGHTCVWKVGREANGGRRSVPGRPTPARAGR
jgi:hypothetical protein